MSGTATYQIRTGAATGAQVRLILASGFQADYVREVANAQARLGHAVYVIGGNMHEGQTYHENVTLLNIRGNDKRERNPLREIAKLASYYARLLRCVADAKCDTVYDVSIGRPMLRCVLMYPLFRMLGKHVVYTAHNVLPHDADSVKNRIVYSIVYRLLVDKIVVHGQAIKERIVYEFGVDTERVSVVAHGTYHAKDSADISKPSAREQLGIPKHERVLLCFGLQRFYKGTHFVLEALDNYRAANVTLLVRGHAPERSYQDLVERMVNAHAGTLKVNAKFGAVSNSDMELLFKAADIVLLPYLEGSQSGIKFMAYAYGRPVLASAVGSLQEYIEQGHTGEVFTCGDHAAFCEVLERMLCNLDAYAPESIALYAQEHCSFDTAARQVDAICSSLSRRAA
ncbi:MAG: glycosyltransferase family 4 protein [Candidatus Hydrogenedentes bacterium]|nr:glycosyltransferase family 4 protein [Candidatus Hydrogenedentota bacterium]